MLENLPYLGCSRLLLVVGPFSRFSRALTASLVDLDAPTATLNTAVVAKYLLD